VLAPLPTTPAEQLLDYQQAADRLGVTKKWLQRAVQQRRIPHHRLGHYVRFTECDLAEFIASTRQTAVTPRGRKR
jgi:excisionase family DNA binding protein